ncbi:MAG TPA: chromate transporter [Ktedonobacteraceae bacterium]|nr:chromate transporter [Ktedonobacteraceae bacterium]
MINPLLYFLLFVKASLFSSGGFSNLPSLHQDLLANAWAHDSEFGQALAIGQISPGPNGLWVVSLGYLSYGVAGASLALLAITLPPLLVLPLTSAYNRIAQLNWVNALMRGVSLAIIGITLSVCWTILSRSNLDWRSAFIAAGACGLALTKRVNILIILALAAGAGYLLYGLG